MEPYLYLSWCRGGNIQGTHFDNDRFGLARAITYAAEVFNRGVDEDTTVELREVNSKGRYKTLVLMNKSGLDDDD
jgi:hypothetical protein